MVVGMAAGTAAAVELEPGLAPALGLGRAAPGRVARRLLQSNLEFMFNCSIISKRESTSKNLTDASSKTHFEFLL